MKKSTLYIAFFLISLIFSQCAHMRHRPVLDRSETRLDVIKTALFRNFYHIKTFKGYGTLNVLTPAESFKADMETLIDNPDSVYVKIEATLGIDVGMMFADREQYMIYSPRQNICYTGDSGILDLRSFIGLQLTFGNLLESLMGLELLDELDKAKVFSTEEDIIVSAQLDAYTAIYQIDPYRGVVKQSKVYDSEERAVFIAKYSRFTRIKGIYLPKTIQLTKPLAREAVTLFYTFIKINKTIKPSQFAINVPETVMREAL